MSPDQSSDNSLRSTSGDAPLTANIEPEKSADLADHILPPLFITVAAIILAWLDPVYLQFERRPIETIILNSAGILLIWLGIFSRRRLMMYIGVAVLLAVITFEVSTQPTRLSVPIVAVWPLRIVLVLLVGWSWAFLMRPPRWLSRALFAFALPTLFVFGLWGGPATGAALFGWNVFVPYTNFTPYWLAVDSTGRVYASDASGNLVWVFDEGGSPQGVIRASRAPQVPTPGPGILPNGMVEELALTNINLFPTATPVTATQTLNVLNFCGIATDPKDNLYVVDTIDPTGPKILRFDREGMITARMEAPSGYLPTKGCIAADDEHLYLASGSGQIFILDHAGKVQHEARVIFTPLGITPNGKGELLVTEPNALNKIIISTGEMLTSTLPPPPSQLRVPYQGILVSKNGEILANDWAGNQILRIDPAGEKIIGTIGSRGYEPGQFQGLGGMAEDKEGRLYVADWQHRVIQRFTSDGKIDAVWWAARAVPESPSGAVEIEP